LHWIPQAAPLQVATAFASVGHGEQLAPHVEGLTSLAQTPPQAWKVGWHVSPQTPLLHDS
jgi:hypothetical protein